MNYFQEGGWWLPDNEEHLKEWLLRVDDKIGGRLVYQFKKYREAMRWVVGPRRTAVDVGAHAGLWSWVMAQDFAHVVAFEPIREHGDCWMANMAESPNAELVRYALGADDAAVRMAAMTGGSMQTKILPSGEQGLWTQAWQRRLDDMAVSDIDFLKIDVEGYEYFVCRGGEQTIRKWKPVIIVEQKPAAGMVANYGIRETEAVEFLKSLGAVVRAEMDGDYLLSWDRRIVS